MTYDVIIAGASFAGLAVASRLARARVLLIDRKPPGEEPTSACGTLLGVVQRLGLEESLMQVQDRLAFHLTTRTERFDVSAHPFCTVDYQHFCRGLAKGVTAEFLQARVQGLEGDGVVTDRGRFQARCLVDATGWRAQLGRSLRPSLVEREKMSFGIETVAPRRGETLGFWFDPTQIPQGVAWFFPIGGAARMGVASYASNGHLKGHLDIFLEDQGVARSAVHGGFFTARLRPPTLGPVFLVGDAAGQCLPLTGEGIRPALFFGQACGAILQRVLDGELTPAEGRAAYWAVVRRRRPMYWLLGLLQQILLKAPISIGERLVAAVCREPLASRILRGYVAFADPAELTPVRGLNDAPARTGQAWETASQPAVMEDSHTGEQLERSPGDSAQGAEGRETMAKDPVCGMEVDEKHAAATAVYQGQTYYFCAQGCRDRFLKDPKRYLGGGS